MTESTLRPIARIKSDYKSKFGIPRQSGIVKELEARIVFEKEFSDREAIRGIEEFSHLWLIWQFSENLGDGWRPTVRPPRLGGNERRGVFATRSPYRPNALGLSCVKLLGVEEGDASPELRIAGADLLDGTPIFDIKPYIPYTDCVPDAESGFAPDEGKRTGVVIPPELEEKIKPEKRAALREILSLDPRPSYRPEGDRVYRFEFADMRIGFIADEGTITVTEIEKTE